MEDTFAASYNELAKVLCPESTRSVDSVVIARDTTNYSPPGDGSTTRIFTLLSQITIPIDASLFSGSQDIAVRRRLDDAHHRRQLIPLSSHIGGKGSKGESGSSNSNIPAMDSDGVKSASCPGLTGKALAFREAVRAKSSELRFAPRVPSFPLALLSVSSTAIKAPSKQMKLRLSKMALSTASSDCRVTIATLSIAFPLK